MSGPALIRLAALCAALGALAPAASAETLDLPHGLSVQLPEGWVVDGSPQGEVSRSGMRRVQLVCESEACEQTQETCTLLMQAKPLEGDDDDTRLQALYASPLKRYFRLRAVLRATSPDADIRQPLERVRIGDRDWYRVETDARHQYRSGVFAETVVDGLYVGAICKSCETGEQRHLDGLRIIESLKSTAKATTAR